MRRQLPIRPPRTPARRRDRLINGIPRDRGIGSRAGVADRRASVRLLFTGSWWKVSRVFPARPEEMAKTRRFLCRLRDGCPMADDAVLICSELATNAIVHSGSAKPGGLFTVRSRSATATTCGQSRPRRERRHGRGSSLTKPRSQRRQTPKEIRPPGVCCERPGLNRDDSLRAIALLGWPYSLQGQL